MHNVDVIIDSPVFFFWKELSEIWPKAKLILSMRDSSEVWWRSSKSFWKNLNNWPYIKYGWFLVFLTPTGWKIRQQLILPSLTMIYGTLKMFQNYEDLDNGSVKHSFM